MRSSEGLIGVALWPMRGDVVSRPGRQPHGSRRPGTDQAGRLHRMNPDIPHGHNRVRPNATDSRPQRRMDAVDCHQYRGPVRAHSLVGRSLRDLNVAVFGQQRCVVRVHVRWSSSTSATSKLSVHHARATQRDREAPKPPRADRDETKKGRT